MRVLRLMAVAVVVATVGPEALAAKAAPLIKAILERNTELALSLVPTSDVNNAESSGISPLQLAANLGEKEVVAALLVRGARVDYASGTFGTALSQAIIANHQAVADLLMDKGADVNFNDEKSEAPLFLACRHTDASFVQRMIARGANPRLYSKKFGSALIWAAKNGDPEIVRLMLEQKVDLEIKNEAGASPLFVAAVFGKAAAAQALLQAGARVNTTTNTGLTPLHGAAEADSLEITQLLLAHGADPLAVQSVMGGRTVLDSAMITPHRPDEVTDLLIAKGARLTKRPANGLIFAGTRWAMASHMERHGGDPKIMAGYYRDAAKQYAAEAKAEKKTMARFMHQPAVKTVVGVAAVLLAGYADNLGQRNELLSGGGHMLELAAKDTKPKADQDKVALLEGFSEECRNRADALRGQKP